MSTVRCLVAVLLFLVLPGAAVADHHETPLMQEVKAIGDALTKAMLAKDVDTMLGMYAENAISLPNYSPRMDGKEAFKKHHEEMSASGMNIVAFASDPSDVWEAGDQVIEIGSYEIELEMPGLPATIKDKGKYMTVYVRGADKSLKIKVETWNTDIDPMAMGDHGHSHDQ